MRLYTLDADGEPVPESDPLTWAVWLHTAGAAGRIVGHTEFGAEPGTVYVHTTFVGIDLEGGPGDVPVLWASFVVGGPLDGEIRVYQSADGAAVGHQVLVDDIARALGVARPA
jgi:hypothetical protein